MNIKDMVKDGKKVRFSHYKSQSLWYLTEDGFIFPVPLSDIDVNTSFMAEEKAILLMKWINRQLKVVDMSKKIQQETII